MPIVLSHDRKQEIYQLIKKAFSDFRYFDERLTACVHKMIDYATKEDFDSRFMSELMEDCFGNQYLVECNASKEKKDIYQTMKIILHATVIYLFALNPIVQDRLYATIDDLLTAYPAFVDQLAPIDRPEHQKELRYLLIFRNFMATALLLLPAKENKIFLLRVIERLEGSNEQYITGTGQKASTTRRCDIFHQESGTTMIKKRPRKPKDLSNHPPTLVSRETSISSDSSSAVLMLKVPVVTPRSTKKGSHKRKLSELEETIIPITASKAQKVTPMSVPQRSVIPEYPVAEGVHTVSPRQTLTSP